MRRLWNRLRIVCARMSTPPDSESAVSARCGQQSARPIYWCGGILLLLAGPQFLRMPLTNDAQLFDLQARMISEGSVAYRDVLEPNWPGVLWVHAAVRRILGGSSEALRFFDLCLLLGTTWLLAWIARRAGIASRSAGWLSVAILVFYLGSTEWCHCQRDLWLLAPVTAAVTLRMRRLDQEVSPRVCAWSAVAEGLAWAPVTAEGQAQGLVSVLVQGLERLPNPASRESSWRLSAA